MNQNGPRTDDRLFVSKDESLWLSKDGTIGFAGVNKVTGKIERYGTMLNPRARDVVVAAGKELRRFLDGECKVRTGRFEVLLGLIVGQGSQQLMACIGAEDMVIRVLEKGDPRAGGSDRAFSNRYSLEEVRQFAEALIKVGP